MDDRQLEGGAHRDQQRGGRTGDSGRLPRRLCVLLSAPLCQHARVCGNAPGRWDRLSGGEDHAAGRRALRGLVRSLDSPRGARSAAHRLAAAYVHSLEFLPYRGPAGTETDDRQGRQRPEIRHRHDGDAPSISAARNSRAATRLPRRRRIRRNGPRGSARSAFRSAFSTITSTSTHRSTAGRRNRSCSTPAPPISSTPRRPSGSASRSRARCRAGASATRSRPSDSPGCGACRSADSRCPTRYSAISTCRV